MVNKSRGLADIASSPRQWMPVVITEGESHFPNVPIDCWLSCLSTEDGTTYNIKCLSAFPIPHFLRSISYAVYFCCILRVHVPWLNVSFSFRWQRPCSTSWLWMVCSVYRLTHNAKNMWRWKQSLNCFVWGRGKTRKLEMMKEYAAKLPPPSYAPLPTKLSDDTGEP